MSYICVGFNGTLLINLATVCSVEKGISGASGFSPDGVGVEETFPEDQPALRIQFIHGSRVMEFDSTADRDRVFDSLQPRRTGVVLPG